MKMVLISLVAIISVIQFTRGQSCLNWHNSVDCNVAGSCKWIDGTNGQCNCASQVKLDILFGIDTSESIGWSGFQIQKQFVKGLVDQEINNGSRIGFFMFNTNVNKSRHIQLWDKDDLLQFVDGMWWSGGDLTNTAQLISDGLVEFVSIFNPNRRQIFVIITDGNPCLSDAQGGCPQTVCQYKTQILRTGKYVLFIYYI